MSTGTFRTNDAESADDHGSGSGARLRLHGVTKRYGRLRAIDDVSPAEVHTDDVAAVGGKRRTEFGDSLEFRG